MKKVLIVTNRCDSHVDYLIEMFHQTGLPFVRFNTDDYPIINTVNVEISSDSGFVPTLSVYGEEVTQQDIGCVWLRRPLKPRIDASVTDPKFREYAQDEAKALTEGLWMALHDVPWVSNFDRIRYWQHKVPQLRFAQSLGFQIPPTLITTSSTEFLKFWEAQHGEVIYKPLGTNMITREDGGINTAYTNKLDPTFLEHLDAVSVAPCIFQGYIPKKYELRITVVGTQVFACEIHSQASEKTKIDWRHYDIENTPHRPGKLPPQVEAKCVELVQKMGLKFGAIDMVVTPDDQYIFIEINPNGQWLWIEQQSGLPIGKALFDLLTNYL